MDITCCDKNGNILHHLTQWDVGQEVRIEGVDTSVAPSFHFFNRKSNMALVVPATAHGSSVSAAVPNILLQEPLPIVACVYYKVGSTEGRTSYTVRIPVTPRPKPNDYEYIENIGYDSFIELSEDVKALIESMKNVTFKANETHIQYTQDGKVWTDVVALDDLKGKDGITPNITIGTVETLAEGSQATVEMTGTKENPILNMGIPKGDAYVHSEEFASLAEGVKNDALTASNAASSAAGSASSASQSANSAEGFSNSAEAAKNAAEGFATNAKNSESAVHNDAEAAKTAAVNAKASEDNALESANTASTQADAAAGSASAAAGSAESASTSASNAKGSEDAAAGSASAAAGSAEQSKTHAGNASTSASQASESATNAGKSAENAAGSASGAAQSATEAGESATNASASAATASEQAGIATSGAERSEAAAATAELLVNSHALRTWEDWQTATRLGNAAKILAPGDQFAVDKVKSTVASVSGSGVSGATVDKIQFITARGQAKPGMYAFKYNGTAWEEDGKPVDIASMGIVVEGSPKEDDIIVVTEETTEILFDVAGIDYDVPSDPNYTHSITLLAHDCFENCPFDQAELLWYCNPETRPDGLPAGTYNITLDHGSYGDGTLQDGTYQFTTKQTIPAGGGIRHTTMGGYQSAYTKDQILGGTFVTYNAERETVESGLTTTEGSAGTNLGTASGRYTTHRVGEDINLTERQYYGSNKWVDSAIRQYLNSDKASGWHTLSNKFDRPQTSPVAGFLYGLDPSFVKVLGQVKKRTLVFQTGEEPQKYVDTDELVHLASMTEVGFGANDGVWETPLAGDAPKQEAYPMFKDATNADRIKYLGSSARWWWLRGAYPWNAYYVRCVRADGSLGINYAGNNYGAVPGLCII